MKKMKKKHIPSYITIRVAKECNMYHPNYVVGKTVVTVPRLSAADVRKQSKSNSTTSSTTSPPATAPLSAPPPAATPARTQPPPTIRVSTQQPEFPVRKRRRLFHRRRPVSTKNILVVGIVSHSGTLSGATQRRDQSRIDELAKEYDTVFSLAPCAWDTDISSCHVNAKMGVGGAHTLLQTMRSQHANIKLQQICLEYIRFPSSYYRQMLIGDLQDRVPGRPLLEFVSILGTNGALADNCSVIFVRQESDERWTTSLKRWTSTFGTPHFLCPTDNPLFNAADRAELGEWDNTAELMRLSGGSLWPFVEFTIPTSTWSNLQRPSVHRTTGPSTRSTRVNLPFVPPRTAAPASPVTASTSPVPDATPPSSSALPTNLSPEGLSVLAPMQTVRTPLDNNSEYVARLETTVDRLAQEKKRLSAKLECASARVKIIIREVEKELGPMPPEEKKKFWEDIAKDNPVENSSAEPIFAELTGLVYPSSWGGTAKYNLTSPTMSDKTCRMLYGFPVSFAELTHLITKVFFPKMVVKRSALVFGTSLTDFEKALATLQLFKTGEPISEIAHHWGVRRRRMGEYCTKWSKLWSDVALVFCRLDPNKRVFEKIQPVGYNYGMPIAVQTDGSTINIQTSRKFSAKARSSYSDKTGTQAAQGITWSTCIGLVLLVTSLFCARVAEKELVRIHQSWLHIFPKKFGRLVDRGFTFCTQWYKNLLKAFAPAFVNRETGDITHRQVLDARMQSSHRYVCEVVYSRVKQFRILTGKCHSGKLRYLTAAWYVAHMVANLYGPLATPDCMHEWSNDKLESALLGQ